MKALQEGIPARLGPYELRYEIGRGGMGVVYLARQTSLQRDVALKTLPPYFAHDEALRKRFEKEALAAAALSHPNCVSVHDFGEEGEYVYLVMEYVDGESIAQMISRRGRIPPAEGAAILRQVAAGLDHAHSRGLLHRDLKPSNLFVNKEGRVQLGDFGLARIASQSQATRGSMFGAGTPEYMAPEVCRGELGGKPADIYALGVVAYEMLAGARPFSAEEPLAILLAHTSEPVRPIEHVSTEVNAALERALAKNAADRYPSATAFAEALAEAAASAPAVAATAAPVSDPTVREALTRPRSPHSPVAAPEAATADVVAPDSRSVTPTRPGLLRRSAIEKPPSAPPVPVPVAVEAILAPSRRRRRWAPVAVAGAVVVAALLVLAMVMSGGSEAPATTAVETTATTVAPTTTVTTAPTTSPPTTLPTTTSSTEAPPETTEATEAPPETTVYTPPQTTAYVPPETTSPPETTVAPPPPPPETSAPTTTYCDPDAPGCG